MFYGLNFTKYEVRVFPKFLVNFDSARGPESILWFPSRIYVSIVMGWDVHHHMSVE